MEQGKLETEEERWQRRHERYLKDKEQNKPWANHKDKNGNKVKQKYTRMSDLPEDKREIRREIRHRAYLKGVELGKSWAISKYEAKKKRGISEEERERRRKASAKWRAEHPERTKENMIRWRKEHGEEQKRSWCEYRRKNKVRSIEYLGGKCSQCNGVFHPDIYDFHHKDPSEKDICVAKLMAKKFESIIPELDKCMLVCANCHRVIHAQY